MSSWFSGSSGKDVKLAKVDGGKEVQGSVAGTTATSKSVQSEDYFLVKDKENKTKGSKKDSKEEGVQLVGHSKEGGKDNLEAPGVSQVHSLLAGLALTPASAEQLIRRELLLSRFKSDSNALAETKHFYSVGTGSVTTSETTVSLASIVGGTASNTRTTNSIELNRATVRAVYRLILTGPSTIAPFLPGLTQVVWRDNVPSTVGTPPTVFGTDTNPPSSTTLVYSRCGASTDYNQLAVRNPVTSLDYHVYDIKHIDLVPCSFDYSTPATAYGVTAPTHYRMETKIDLNKVRQDYAAYSSTDPDVNAVYVTWVLDTTLTNLGYSVGLYYLTDTEFRDLQI